MGIPAYALGKMHGDPLWSLLWGDPPTPTLSVTGRAMRDCYTTWEKACRAGGAIDQEEDGRDVETNAGAFAEVAAGPAHDVFALLQGQSGEYRTVSYASDAAQEQHAALAEKVHAAGEAKKAKRG